MSANRRGISQTPFLITFIILTFLASVIAYMFSTQVETQKGFTQRALAGKLDIKKKYEVKWEEVRKLREALGYYQEAGGDAADATSTDADLVRTELDKLNTPETMGTPVSIKPLTVKIMLTELARAIARSSESIN